MADRKLSIEDMGRAEFVIELAPGDFRGLPLMVVARDRAAHYVHEFGGSFERSLREDTLELFAEDLYEADDWRRNNMNLDEVKPFLRRVERAPEPQDLDDGWVNGNAQIVYYDANNVERVVYEHE